MKSVLVSNDTRLIDNNSTIPLIKSTILSDEGHPGPKLNKK
jgi:hypothetical protein